MIDLRYDGPDLEAETNSRAQGTVMAAVMVAEAAQQGRQVRAERTAAARDAADRSLWRDTPADQLADLGDEALSARWQACARHHGDSEANEVRGRIEAELDARDPETMRDYRSWRNAGLKDPGAAMQSALAERERRLGQVWEPLAGPGADDLPTEQVLQRWAASHSAHGTTETQAAVKRARTAGEELLRQREPELMRGYDELRGVRGPAGAGPRLGLADAEAAARAAGTRLAFGSGGWAAVRTGGAATAGTAARTAAASTGPAGLAATAAASTVQRMLRRGQQL